MKFEVIEGGWGSGASNTTLGRGATTPTKADVEREAARRLSGSGYEQWRVREFVTGAAMPAELKYFRMQIDFVASMLSKLAIIPDDFHADIYWPAN